jgi:hypothetical protein
LIKEVERMRGVDGGGKRVQMVEDFIGVLGYHRHVAPCLTNTADTAMKYIHHREKDGQIVSGAIE